MIYLILIFFLIFVFGISYKIEVTHTYIKSKKIKNETKFAVIGDLHSCNYGENMEKVVDLIIKENPDFILNVGDMYDHKLNIENSDKYFKAISNFKSYYVSGNHELYKRYDIEYKKNIRSFNTRVLEGEKEKLFLKDSIINIAGVDDIQINKRFKTQLKRALKNVDNNFTILMFHRPHLIELFNTLNVDLVVSGHAHSGQWRIPFTRIGIFAPQQKFFPKYTNGLYKLKNTLLFVTRGLAKENVLIPRVYNRPEISIIHLLPE